MNKIFFALCCFALSISLTASAQKVPAKFDVVVSFGSMASGPASDSFLKSFITKFSKKYAVKVVAYKAAGCGREGEFTILFSSSRMKSAIKKKFVAQLNTVVASEEKKNRAKDEHSGNITVDYDKTQSDYSYCRRGISLWK